MHIYDELLRFKKSVAVVAAKNIELTGISNADFSREKFGILAAILFSANYLKLLNAVREPVK